MSYHLDLNWSVNGLQNSLSQNVLQQNAMLCQVSQLPNSFLPHAFDAANFKLPACVNPAAAQLLSQNGNIAGDLTQYPEFFTSQFAQQQSNLHSALLGALNSVQPFLKSETVDSAGGSSSLSSFGRVHSSQQQSQNCDSQNLGNLDSSSGNLWADLCSPTCPQPTSASAEQRRSAIHESDIGCDDDSDDLLNSDGFICDLERHPRCGKPLLPGRERKREAQRRYRAGLRRTEQALSSKVDELKKQVTVLQRQHQKLSTHEQLLHKLIGVIGIHLDTHQCCKGFKTGMFPPLDSLQPSALCDPQGQPVKLCNLRRLLLRLRTGKLPLAACAMSEALPQVLQRWYAAVQELALCLESQLHPGFPMGSQCLSPDSACDNVWGMLWVLAVSRPNHFVMAQAAGSVGRGSDPQLRNHWDKVLAAMSLTSEQEDTLLQAAHCFLDAAHRLHQGRAWLLGEMFIACGWQSSMSHKLPCSWMLQQEGLVKYAELLKGLNPSLAYEQAWVTILYGLAIQTLSLQQLAIFVLKSRPLLPGVVEMICALSRSKGEELNMRPVIPEENL